MLDCQTLPHKPSTQRTALGRLLSGVALVSSLALGACSGGAGNPFEQIGLADKPAVQSGVATGSVAPAQTELQKATDYWGKQSQKDPHNTQAAINYVRNLKALGAKPEAFQVIQAAYGANPNNRDIASEYGRLALEQDQVSLAEKLLVQADDPVKPDWKVVSAHGTVLAKQGKYREAIPLFERALALAPNQASVMNNLALAYAMDGHAEKAEPLLRQAANDTSADPRVAKNLTLVLGLQGKSAEAHSVILKDAPDEDMQDDAKLLKDMVGTPAVANGRTQTAATPTAPRIKTGALAPITASATAKRRTQPKLAVQQPPEDPAILVRRLADGYATSAADPVQLVPKQ